MISRAIGEANSVTLQYHHPVLLLVFLYEGVSDLASFDVPLCAHGVRIANHAGAFFLGAPVGWSVFYQPFFDQPVPRRLKGVQGKILDATLEKATPLSTVFSKTGLLLEN